VAQRRAEALRGSTITVKARAAEEGKLYGSVGPYEIVEALKAKGIEAQKREVQLIHGPIRVTGEHEIALQLHSDVEVQIKVIVEEEEES
jgi:large subunit ribosomal protein L9